MPTFSIVLVNYNTGQYLEQAIRSILDQSYKNFELIVVDGGSADNSVEVIEKYSKQITWWVSEKDKGQSDAFNKGFARAKGDFFLWVNADDLLLPGALAASASYFERHPDCEWLAGDTILFTAGGQIHRCLHSPYWNWKFMKPLNHWFIQQGIGDLVNGPSSIFHRSLFEKVGGFDTTLHFGMDLDIWLKFVDLNIYPQILSQYIWAFRIHEGSKTFKSVGRADDKRVAEELNLVRSRSNRGMGESRYWLLKLFKVINGSHFHTIYDSWLRRGKTVLISFADKSERFK